ncbi:hypothetical protein FQA39_LY16922 [Lamprigera yunnana]|nr:hypothetical protein FQA39_LY16922 [Lamprigera yunnana]
MRNCRTNLQEKFEECDANTDEGQNHTNRSILTIISLNDTRKILRSGAERFCKTLSSLRTSIGMFSQKFRLSTKRRQLLEEGPTTPNSATPHTISRAVLGRTPTKLYSPFCIDTPYKPPMSIL